MRFLASTTSLVTRADWQSRDGLIRLGIFLAVIGIAVAALFFRDQLTLSQVGYTGIALSTLVASGALVLPVPALATVCVASTALNPVFVGLIAGTIGELTGYFLGYSGRGILSRRRLYQKLEGWMRRRGWLLLFLVSLIPNPIFDVVGVAAGALRYPLWGFLGVVWVGKLLKFLIVVYACKYSSEWILDIFGV